MVIKKKESIHPSNGIIIRYDGIIDIDALYKGVKSWFVSHKYDYYESENTEKNKPQGNTLIIKMLAQREIDDYVRFDFEVDFDEIKKVKKLSKGYSGEARITIRCFMTFYYKGNWTLLPFLFYIYNNVILKKKILTYYWVKAYDEMMELNSYIKSTLGLIE